MSTFATLELRATRAAVRRTSNATAVWSAGGVGVGAPVPGIRVVFDNAAEPAMGSMVNGTDPVASVFAPDMPGAKRGDALSITRDATDFGAPSAVVYSIAQARPDGSGLLVLELQSEPTP